VPGDRVTDGARRATRLNAGEKRPDHRDAEGAGLPACAGMVRCDAPECVHGDAAGSDRTRGSKRIEAAPWLGPVGQERAA
jgi:hypothetical protein